jgi:hypothetical protein
MFLVCLALVRHYHTGPEQRDSRSYVALTTYYTGEGLVRHYEVQLLDQDAGESSLQVDRYIDREPLGSLDECIVNANRYWKQRFVGDEDGASGRPTVTGRMLDTFHRLNIVFDELRNTAEAEKVENTTEPGEVEHRRIFLSQHGQDLVRETLRVTNHDGKLLPVRSADY